MNLSAFADTINQDGPDQYEQSIDNSSYFYRKFKEKYGVSPKEYRSPNISRP
jgi:methylphosphotriester-DNA--protein-cysteine methyltransferase